jgi:hypothetical protein
MNSTDKKTKRTIKFEMNATKDLTDKMLIFYPHDMKPDELPLTQEEFIKRIFNPMAREESQPHSTDKMKQEWTKEDLDKLKETNWLGYAIYSAIKQQEKEKSQSQPHSTDWQEEWREKFDYIYFGRKGISGYKFPDKFEEDVKKFIQSLIDASYKRGRREVLESMPIKKIDINKPPYKKLKKLDCWTEILPYLEFGFNDSQSLLQEWREEQLNQTHRKGKNEHLV